MFIISSANESLWGVATTTACIDDNSNKFLKIKTNTYNNVDIFFKFLREDLESRFIIIERKINETQDTRLYKLAF